MSRHEKGRPPAGAFEAADRFKPDGTVADIREHGNGRVHDTFLVTMNSGAERRFILQRMNTHVFRRPDLVMRNMRIFSEHVRQRLEETPLDANRRWEVVRVLLTPDGGDHWVDPEGSFWRAMSFIDGARSFDAVQDMEHAKEVGSALGLFHSLIADCPPESLADTLEGFHVTPRYLQHYDEVLATHSVGSSSEECYALRFVSERRCRAQVLEDGLARGRLRLRPIHGDPKVGNVMMDTTTQKAVSLVDLDTVKPGLIHYDIGDCLRSCCNLPGGDSDRWEEVRFEPDLCRAILRGYLAWAGDSLTADDYSYVFDAVHLISFELGLRYLTDYLEGNVYFKVRYPEQNLLRALARFKLTESIESQEATIRTIVQDER